MAHSRSAKKRIRQNEKRNALNNWRKRQVRGSVKAFEDAVAHGDAAQATDAYKAASKTLDKISAKGTIHKNTAARKKSRLAKRLNAMQAASAA